MGVKSSKVAVTTKADRPLVQVNDKFPDGTVYESYPAEQPVSLDELLRGRPMALSQLLKGKKTILIGVPGAFTPNCHQYHLPGYIAKAEDFLKAGADQILCLAANDVFCCESWSEQLSAKGKVRILADPKADIAAKMGMALDLNHSIGRRVYKRFSCICEDGVIKLLFVEGDGLGLQCTMAVPLLTEFTSQKYKRLYVP